MRVFIHCKIYVKSANASCDNHELQFGSEKKHVLSTSLKDDWALHKSCFYFTSKVFHWIGKNIGMQVNVCTLTLWPWACAVLGTFMLLFLFLQFCLTIYYLISVCNLQQMSIEKTTWSTFHNVLHDGKYYAAFRKVQFKLDLKMIL